MKKLFWLVVVILLVITFSDHNLIRLYKEQLFALIMDKAAIAGDSKEAALRTTRKQLLALSQQWGEGQRTQLDKASSSIDNVLQFQRNYCKNGDFNPFLYGEPLKQSCAIIENQMHNLTKP
ncbi:MAG: hypothetical protein CVV11_18755 [Gammaproteobacteria bacterium HGW-Gammaproteobacteria-15]|nr:MAG: hypothetical protein CVV11_18755 [Gammaproteobacteria bacterium HGW-Gammaproteobacteria-15]